MLAMNEVTVPEWTLPWRMQRAMAHADLRIEDMAAELGVSRATVSRWLNEHGGPPRIGYLKLWALRCGVPLEWLRSGEDVRTRGFFRPLAAAA
jgi:transcriptional regulator with XRE-family HTH domain